MTHQSGTAITRSPSPVGARVPEAARAVLFALAALPLTAVAGFDFGDDFGNGARLPWGNERGAWTVVAGQYSASQPENLPPTAALLPWVVGDFELSVDVIDPADGGIWLRAGSGATRGVMLIVKPDTLYWHVIADPITGPYTSYGQVVVTLPPTAATRIRVVGSGLVLQAYVGSNPEQFTLKAWVRPGAGLSNPSNSNPVTPVGAPGFAPARVGRGVSLDGTMQHLAAPTPQGLPFGSQGRTITLWAKTPRNLLTNTDTGIFQYGITDTGRVFGLITSLNASGALYCYGSSRDVAGSTLLAPARGSALKL